MDPLGTKQTKEAKNEKPWKSDSHGKPVIWDTKWFSEPFGWHPLGVGGATNFPLRSWWSSVVSLVTMLPCCPMMARGRWWHGAKKTWGKYGVNTLDRYISSPVYRKMKCVTWPDRLFFMFAWFMFDMFAKICESLLLNLDLFKVIFYVLSWWLKKSPLNHELGYLFWYFFQASNTNIFLYMG